MADHVPADIGGATLRPVDQRDAPLDAPEGDAGAQAAGGGSADMQFMSRFIII